MGTPHNPALEELLPGEPFLILRGSDATAGRYTRAYANDLMIRKSNEPRQPGDMKKIASEVGDIHQIADDMDAWYAANKTPPTPGA